MVSSYGDFVNIMNFPSDFTIDFMGVGTPKCGTEWLVACLSEHPEIDFSQHKEPHFFLSPPQDNEFFQNVYTINRLKTVDEYRNDFSWDTGKKRGEFSIQYVFDKPALMKVKEAFPNIRIILAIRNPVRFLYSLYWYLKYSHAHHKMPDTFEEAIASENTTQPYHKSKARFATHIKNCMDIFSKEQLLVVPLLDIRDNPKKTLKEVYEFIGVDSSFEPSVLYKRKNKTTKLRHPFIAEITDFAINTMLELKMDRALNNLINTDCFIKKAYRKIMYTSESYPPMAKATEQKLKEEFRQEVETIEQLLQRDLQAWK